MTDAGSGRIYFGDESGSGKGKIIYDHYDDRMSFYANDNQVMRVLDDGVAILGDQTPTSLGTNADGVLAIGVGTIPTTSITNGIQLYATGANAELVVRDEAGNTTTLSPHNFSLFEPVDESLLPWSYHSSKDGVTIEVDMYRAIKAIEALTGEQLIYYEYN